MCKSLMDECECFLHVQGDEVNCVCDIVDYPTRDCFCASEECISMVKLFDAVWFTADNVDVIIGAEHHIYAMEITTC